MVVESRATTRPTAKKIKNKNDKTNKNMHHTGSLGKEKDILTLPGEVDGVECELILDSGVNISVFRLEQVRAERVDTRIAQFCPTRRELQLKWR